MQTTIGPGPANHDPNGPDVQIHEIEDEVYITFSDEFVEEHCWQDGDELVWDLSPSGPRVSNPQAEVRRRLREKVNELLQGGPEL